MNNKDYVQILNEDYDWEEAFELYASPERKTFIDEKDISYGRFTRDDVEIVHVMIHGANDEQDWIGVFQLKDKRFASLTAGCDYTGWG